MWRAYWNVLRPIRGLACLVVLSMALGGLLEGCAILAIIPVLEPSKAGNASGIFASLAAATGLAELGPLVGPLAIFALLGVGAALVRMVSDVALLWARTDVEKRVRLDVADALLRIEWPRFLSLYQGDVAKSVIIDGNQIASGTHFFLVALGSVLTALVYVTTAMFVSVQLTIFALFFGGLIGGLYKIGFGRVRVHADALSSIVGNIGQRVAEVFGSLKFFKASGQSAVAKAQVNSIFSDYADKYYCSQRYVPLLRAVFDVGAVLFIGALLLWRIGMEGDSVAEIIAFLAIFYRLAPKLASIQDGLFQARTYLSWYQTWQSKLDYSFHYPEPEYGREKPVFTKQIRYSGVSVRFPGMQSPALSDVSATIERTECVALVGASGSGKSTFADLLTELLAPAEGSILVDGVPLASFDANLWRARIGVVQQENPLFHTTIAGNVAWGGEHEDEEKIVACLKRAHAWEFVEKLPDGLRTEVGEKGAKLSGGQRQRIAIARALYRDPWLLILDEATSALDGESEQVVQDSLDELKGSCALLIVAHRLKTVKRADKILVLDHGRLLEEGSWKELTDKRGVFWKMAQAQSLVEEGTE